VARKIPDRFLAEWLRSMQMQLRAGLPMLKSLERAAEKGPRATRPVSERLIAHIKDGSDLSDAIAAEKDSFPPVVVSMAQVGQQAGHLPEIFRRLEEFVRFQMELRREFYSRIALPVFQFVAAIGVIGLLIFIMGLLPGGIDVLGLGLKGGRGALIWYGAWVGLVLGLFGLWKLARRSLSGMAWMDRLLLRIPAIGPCLESLALSRLSIAMSITFNTGASVIKSLKLSLAATDNGALIAEGDRLKERIKAGSKIGEAMSESPVFPPEFTDVVTTAELAGQLPEQMAQQAELLGEQARHRLKILNTAAGFAVWVVVAVIIIVFIFRIFTIAYLNPLREALKGM
jgi:type IV pilus assembly protein PilC